jgi:hypothetical protein
MPGSVPLLHSVSGTTDFHRLRLSAFVFGERFLRWILGFLPKRLVTNMISQTPDDIVEIAQLLAIGLLRLEARKSSQKPAEFGESSLHFSPDQSGGVHPYAAEVSHD